MGEFRTERHGAANVQPSQMVRGPQAGPRGSGSEGYGEETRPEGCVVAGGGDVGADDRRARIMAAVTEPDTTAGAGELARRLCRFAVDEMALSGCAIVLMSGAESATVLAGAGRHARTVTGLQMELGEGPCLQAHAAGSPVLLPDLAAGNANRWPAFAAAALAAGVQAEFSLPLMVGPGGIGTFDLCRDRAGMLSDEHLADALVADIARDAVLYQPYAAGPGLAELLDTAGPDRIVIHHATGMIAAQLDDSVANALARLRAAAFASGRPIYDIARDVVERRVRFDE
jgi:GAF domain